MLRYAGSGAALVAVLVLAGCGSDSDSASDTPGVKTIEVTVTDDGCEPAAITADAGPTTFHVSNKGSGDDATEFEVIQDTTIFGEIENVEPGKEGSLSLTLQPGTYVTKCRGGTTDTGSLEVTGTATAAAADPAASAAAVTAYLAYVADESKQLVAAVQPFADAVKAGDIEKAKSLFAAARYHYESIEPIAESFGDLDPEIDAREGDVPDAEWGGFHRIEKALWTDNTTDGMSPVADKLVADIASLNTKIATIELEPAQIANGAVELLNEVSASKITGEEDRYSHTDLSDFAANLAGAQAAFVAVRPLLATSDAALAGTIDTRFADTSAALDTHKDPAGIANGYAAYDTLSTDQTKALSTSVDALAEPLSQVAALVLQ